MKLKLIILLFIFSMVNLRYSYGWGAEGHAIVARLAMQFVKDDVRQNVLQALNGMSIDTAANWMDIMKSNSDYEFMRSWHYVDFAKGEIYKPTNQENIINRLTLTYNELKHKNTLCDAQIKDDLCILFHLTGDLHMPLHTGYEDDLGGNKTTIKYDTNKISNLHSFWDEGIIHYGKITDNSCLTFYNKSMADSIKLVDFTAWMYDGRKLLDSVYAFPGYVLDENYLQKNKTVVQHQLLKAGLHLALILNRLFYTPSPDIDFAALAKTFPNGIEAKDAAEKEGKRVTVCARVFSIKSTDAITQLSLGGAYPNNPMTVVIFAKNYSKFDIPFEDLYKNRNITVKGIIENYKGKQQIIIDEPGDIRVL
ncbi:MAG: S1/P1 nuclease [Chitinophagales bacterium]